MLDSCRLRQLICVWTGFAIVASAATCGRAQATKSAYDLARCEILPLADQQVSFRIDGVEKVRWHYGNHYPRPFFYPLNGPSGTSLTRMGHPGAPNHDHHQSIWMAHYKVNGLDFWGNERKTSIRQKQWYAYQDGRAEAVMATAAGWFDSDGKEVMQHDMVAAIMPLEHGEHALEIQMTLRPPQDGIPVELEQTNFGLLAVRVAKSLAAHFGGGQLTNSLGQVGEKEIFAQPAKWVDYSGPIAVGQGEVRTLKMEGITFFDHPQNPRFPTHWHVREDGWMGAAFCLDSGWSVTADSPLTLRYLLHAHSDVYSPTKAEAVHQAFARRTNFEIVASDKPHQQYEVRRVP